MKITKVNIRPVDMNKVKAIASITIDDDFVVHSLRVVEGEKGTFVAMPSRRLPSGEYRDIAHPINTETREMVQSAVLAEFENMKRSMPRPEKPEEGPEEGLEEEPREEVGPELAEEPGAEESEVEEPRTEEPKVEEPGEVPVGEAEEPSEEPPTETGPEEPQADVSSEEEPTTS